MKRFLFFWFLTFLSNFSWASGVVPGVPSYTAAASAYYPETTNSSFTSLKSMMCSHHNSVWVTIVSTLPSSPPQSGSVFVSGIDQTGGDHGCGVISVSFTCPPNSTLTNGQCVCNDPYIAENGVCGQPNQCDGKSGQTVSSGIYDWGELKASDKTRVCTNDGCTAVFNGSNKGYKGLVGGVDHFFAVGSYIHTGALCVSNPNNPTPGIPSALASKPVETCATGQVGITSSTGKLNCYNSDGTKAGTKSQATESAEKAEATKKQNDLAKAAGDAAASAVAAAGGSEAEQQSARVDAQKTVVIQEAARQQQQLLCTDNPDLPGCKELNTDDLNKEETQKDIANSLKGVASAVASVDDPTFDETLNESTVDVSGFLNSISFTGSSSCPADRNISLAGYNTVFSFQQVCTGFSYLRVIVLACCALVGLYIVMGRQTEG